MHDPLGLRPARSDWDTVRVKPPLPPPDGKRPLSPASYRRSLTRSPLSASPYGALDLGRSASRPTSPEPNRCLSPLPQPYCVGRKTSQEGVCERPLSPTPESEVARILSFDAPPKRNSVVNFPPSGFERDTISPVSNSQTSTVNTEDARRFRPISPPPAPNSRLIVIIFFMESPPDSL